MKKIFFAVLVASACALASTMGYSQAGRTATKALEEIGELIAKRSPRLPKFEVERATALIAKEVRLSGKDLLESQVDDVARSVADYSAIRRIDPDTVACAVRLAVKKHDPRLIARIASRYPYSVTPLVDALTSIPKARIALDAVADGRVVQAVGDLTFRGVMGRQLSGRQIDELVTGWKEFDPFVAGEVFEVVARKQISRGTMSSRLPLRAGAEVIPGQYSGARGLDGIAATIDGRPCVFEFTISNSKSAGYTADIGQLSPDGIALRWNELLNLPETKAELSRVGIDVKYLDSVNADTVAREFGRKLIVDSPDKITDSGRLRWNLGMDDVLALNR